MQCVTAEVCISFPHFPSGKEDCVITHLWPVLRPKTNMRVWWEVVVCRLNRNYALEVMEMFSSLPV